MWTSMTGLFIKDWFTRNKTLVLLGLGALIFVAWTTAAFYAGYRWSEAKHQKDVIVELEERIEKINADFVAFQEAVAQEDIRNQEMTDELVAERDRLAAINTSLQARVQIYAEELDRWRIPIGLVRLLNDAITGVQADAARRVSYEDSRPSTVTGVDLIRFVIGWVVQYKSAQTQCNALIEWNRTNLLNEEASK